MGQRHMRRALLADRTGQAPRVDATDGDTPAPLQPFGQGLRRAPAAGGGRIPFDHHALGHRIGGFVIIGVHADIADMRKGEGHDLPGIGRDRS